MVRVLGKGGFGVVYQVRSATDGKTYALKTYLQGAADRKALNRFRQESEIWIALGAHPYLVQAFFVDEIEGRLFVGMEMISAGPSGHNDIDGFVKNTKPDIKTILKWAIQICYGMEYAELRGIRSHRDIKPANIMIDQAGNVKINDFGLATQPGVSSEETPLTEAEQVVKAFKGQTMRGVGFGTPTYMSPEQFEDAASCDARSDIYSTGVMLYQLVTGDLPVTVVWPTTNSLETRLKFWKEMEAAHRAFRMPSINSPIEPVLAKCIAVDPVHRYPNFKSMRKDLQRILLELGGVEIPEPRVQPMSATDWVTRGYSFSNLHQFREGLHAFRQAIKLDPRSKDAWRGQGRCLKGLLNAELALESYGVVLKMDPTDAVALADRGNCLFALGRLEEAFSAFDHALSVNPKSIAAWIGKGDLLYHLNDFRAAVSCYEQALGMDPKHVGALIRKANYLGQNGDHKGALALFEYVNTLQDGCVDAHRGQAVCNLYLGDFTKAVKMFAELEKNKDMSDVLWLARAVLYARLGKHAEAISALEQVSSVHLHSDAELVRANVLVEMKHYEEALSILERQMDQQDGNVNVQIQFILLLHLCARHKEALRKVPALFAKEQGNLALSLLAVCAGLKTGKDEEALRACQYGLSFHPKSDLLYFNQGVVQAVMGKMDAAADSFESAAALNPSWLAAWSNIGFSSAFCGRTSRGMECLQYVFDASNSELEDFSASYKPHFSVLPDDARLLKPETAIQNMSNGWSPRYRAAAFRPPVLLFPNYMPPNLLASNQTFSE